MDLPDTAVRRSSEAVHPAGGFWLWFLLPVAVHFQRKAHREAEESDGLYEWPRTLLNRPVALFLVVLGGTLALVMLMAAVGVYGP